MIERDLDDGPSYPRRTVIGPVPTSLKLHYPIFSKCPTMATVLFVRDPIPKGISLFLSVLQRTHMTNRYPYDGPSCTTVLVVRDPIPKGLSLFLSVLQRTHVTDRHPYDGPSCTTILVVRDPVPKGLSLFFQVSSNVQLRRTIVPTMVRHS